MPALDTHRLLRAFVDELARCGVAHACTSPGSRSTPIVLALARDGRLSTWSHVDERCAGFFALGIAQATGMPAVIACTSGTAAANFLPAVVEAHEARLPLIVLTADRPPELRDNGAGQAIDQLGLYGRAAKWFVEVGSHDHDAASERWFRTLACRSVWTSLDGRPGPVHLNFPLREPLVPGGPLPDEPHGGREGERPWVTRPRALAAPAEEAAGQLAALCAQEERGVVVLGRGADAGAAVRFAQATAWPLLADPLSGARQGPNAVAHYDALLRVPEFAAAQVPAVVVRVGDLPTSKPLRQWLAGLDALQIAFDPHGAWQDPDGVVATRLPAAPGPALHAVAERLAPRAPGPWSAAWHEADRAAAGAIATVMAQGFGEARIAAELGSLLGDDTTLVIASSMPIRDAETFFASRPSGGPRVLANRGANGIDGTVSTAYGVAATGARTVLWIGDVALAHDIGGLLAGPRLGLALTIVLVNNDGGGIFEFLPVAGEADQFERHVATPHGLDFAHAAALYGAGHRVARDLTQFRADLGLALEAGTTEIVEVRTDRAANVAEHRAIWDAVRDAIA